MITMVGADLVTPEQLAALASIGLKFDSVQDIRLGPYAHSLRPFPTSIYRAVANHKPIDFWDQARIYRVPGDSTPWLRDTAEHDVNLSLGFSNQRGPTSESFKLFKSPPISRRYRFYPNRELIITLSQRTRHVAKLLEAHLDPNTRSLFLQRWIAHVCASDAVAAKTASPCDLSMKALEVTQVLGLANEFLQFAKTHLPHLPVDPAAHFAFASDAPSGTVGGAYVLRAHSLGSDLLYKLVLPRSTLANIAELFPCRGRDYFELVLNRETFELTADGEWSQHEIDLLVEVS